MQDGEFARGIRASKTVRSEVVRDDDLHRMVAMLQVITQTIA